MGTITGQVQGRHQSGSRRKLSALASKISEHKLRLPRFTVLFHKSAWTHEGRCQLRCQHAAWEGSLPEGTQWPHGGVELVEFCSPAVCFTVCLAVIPSGGYSPLTLGVPSALLPARRSPTAALARCPPAALLSDMLTLFMLPALRSHTRGPRRHLGSLSLAQGCSLHCLVSLGQRRHRCSGEAVSVP